MSRSLHFNLVAEQAIAPQAITDGTINGADVDMKNTRALEIEINAGLYTDGVHTFSLEEAANDGAGSPDTYAAVDSDYVIGTDGPTVVIDDAAEDNQVYLMGYTGNADFVRVVCVTTGSTTGLVATAVALKGRLRYSGRTQIEDVT